MSLLMCGCGCECQDVFVRQGGRDWVRAIQERRFANGKKGDEINPTDSAQSNVH